MARRFAWGARASVRACRAGPCSSASCAAQSAVACRGARRLRDILRLDPPPAASTASLPVLGIPNARLLAGRPTGCADAGGALMAERGQAAAAGARARRAAAHFLALSGGGDNGAVRRRADRRLDRGGRPAGVQRRHRHLRRRADRALRLPRPRLRPAAARGLHRQSGRRTASLRRGSPSPLLFDDALADTSPLYRLI